MAPPRIGCRCHAGHLHEQSRQLHACRCHHCAGLVPAHRVAQPNAGEQLPGESRISSAASSEHLACVTALRSGLISYGLPASILRQACGTCLITRA